MSTCPRALIITGGLITGQESSPLDLLRKLAVQTAHAQHAWLDHRVKVTMAEPIIGMALARVGMWRKLRHHPASALAAARRFFAHHDNADTPSLTEVTLLTLLAAEAIPFDTLPLDALFTDPRRAACALADASCVLLSTTYLHDLSELAPVVARVQGAGRRVVLGGALMGALHASWDGMPGVDVVAVGYGEHLIPALAQWMRSGFRDLQPPPRGRLVQKAHSAFLFGGVPLTKDLDDLPTPDWSRAAQHHRRPFPMVYYESVRGCPYRCSFCNYPYLFDDTKFRFKSAQKIADDWQRYADQGARLITCLDSLFTMPRRRLHALCDLLVQRRVPIQWVCYARADDLAAPDTVAMMRAAGALQVQIGIESGDQGQLDRMNKACSVEANHRALSTCRAHGLTSVISLIVGYPGESEVTLENTYRFMEATPPDFYFLATFSARVASVPMMQPPLRDILGLEVHPSLHNMSPYWRHHTMSCAEVGARLRALDQRLMSGRVALNASLFFKHLLGFEPAARAPLLDLQADAARTPLLGRAFGALGRYIDRKMTDDMAQVMGQPQPQIPPLAGITLPLT